jgi:hypothetical protein
VFHAAVTEENWIKACYDVPDSAMESCFQEEGHNMEDLRYPVSTCVVDENITQQKRAAMIEEMDGFADALRALVAGLTDEQLDSRYRVEGWTVRQLVHHLADSTLNWYIRIKMALTEQQPQIKPFDQDAWSALSDARTSPRCAPASAGDLPCLLSGAA